jgi:hypothetical protein
MFHNGATMTFSPAEDIARVRERIRPVRVIPVFLAAILLGAGSPHAQDRVTFHQWLDAVAQHAPGKWDAAAATAAVWNSADLRRIFEALRPQLGAQGHRRPDNNPLLFAGALLHTDVAELASERRRVPVAGDRLVFLSRDGRDYGSQAVDPCWIFARQLLDAVAPDPSTDETVRLWYRATTAIMARYGVLADAQPHLEHARELFPRDATVLFDSGWLMEEFADPRMQAVADGSVIVGVRGVPLPRPEIPSERESLKQAEEFYTRALAVSPADAEALVHRGRVRSRRGRQKEAIEDLRAAAAATSEPYLNYHAALFLGGAYDATGDIEQARAAYEQAAAIYRLAQSPHLALSRLALRRGDMPAAQREVQQVLRLSPDAPNRGDPWWTYHLGHGRNAEALDAELRKVMEPLARGPR